VLFSTEQTTTITSKQKTQKKHEGKQHRNKTQLENMQSVITEKKAGIKKGSEQNP
jgi:hypothetical protein